MVVKPKINSKKFPVLMKCYQTQTSGKSTTKNDLRKIKVSTHKMTTGKNLKHGMSKSNKCGVLTSNNLTCSRL